MTSGSLRWQQTRRDREILAALDLCPMESKDLLALSETFSRPFETLDRVRRTMSRLQAARQVHSWRFAMTGEGGGAAPLYYKLTLDGYRTLHQNEDALPPTKRYLQEIGPGRHRHQQFLTKFIVNTHVAAHRSGLQVIDTSAENTFRIETPLGFLFPDQRFTLAMPTGSRFANCVELDNSTESIWSQKESHSIEMKMRKYLSDLAACNYAYRVQFVVTGARQRKDHILDAAARLQPPIDFAPFYVVHLDEYLSADHPFLEPIFASPKNARIALLRPQAANLHNQAVPVRFQPTTERVALSA
jgi:hypothetical protein